MHDKAHRENVQLETRHTVPTLTRRLALGSAVAGALSALAGVPAHAQSASLDYPNKPVTIVVGYTAGGALDQSTRLLAQNLSQRWKQPVVVDNRPGANGTIAAAYVASAKPDGYTLLATSTSHTFNKFVVKGLRYDPETSFEPIALLVDVPNVLVVKASSPYRSVGELLAAMRSSPKPLSYASQGIGGVPHLAGELFKLRTNTELLHVPYKGAAQGMTDLIGGVVDMSFPSPGSVMAHAKQGTLRVLAVAATQRLPDLKEVPTFAEAGVQDFLVSTWHGTFAPAGTPHDIVNKINADINATMASAEFKQTLKNQGNFVAQPVTPKQFAARLSRELKAFGDVAAKVDLSGS
ncbi:MAG: tripartite tricarboxylate transporter substrate binding protein [Ottowia sp.]|uniref:Bug family tripartite tricarboxylate transporter substrate binding protein n=1 Tax=Ottowia sp. TaxID=1898956 RepID=UPI003C793F79